VLINIACIHVPNYALKLEGLSRNDKSAIREYRDVLKDNIHLTCEIFESKLWEGHKTLQSASEDLLSYNF
jgi:hypothetical protein